jgi:hypothetical protein
MLLVIQNKPPKDGYEMKVNARTTKVTSKPPWMMARPVEEMRRPRFRPN